MSATTGPAQTPTAPTTVTTAADEVGEPVAVDQIPEPRKTAFDRITAHREGSKQPLVAPWLREPEQRDSIVRWAAGYGVHVALFHTLRLPLYQLRLLRLAPRGFWRVAEWVVGGMTDAEARPLRRSAVVRDDVTEYLRLARERNARIRHRAVAAVLLGIPLLGFGVWLAFWASGLAFWAALLVLVDLLGVAGRDRETPLISKATTPVHLSPPMRRHQVEIALRALPGMKRDAVIEYPDPIIKDGPGWLAKVRLPHSYTVSKVLGTRRSSRTCCAGRPVRCG